MKNTFSRRMQARQIRENAAELAFLRPHPDHPNNGEESAYRNQKNQLSYITNFTKGLPHNQFGEVEPEAYRQLLKALTTGQPEDFEKIPLKTSPPKGRKLINPQAGLAFDLEGPDSHSLAMRPAPRIDSAENSAEMGELYWMALLRDVNFSDYHNHALVAEAAVDMSNFSDFRGPKNSQGQVTPATLFRGFTGGDLAGPYISQFLLKGNRIDSLGYQANDGYIQYGTLIIDQRQRTALRECDYMTDADSWLAVQQGLDTSGKDRFETQRSFIRNLRDLATYVHFDELFQAYLNACLILLNLNAPVAPSPFDFGNPYMDSATQNGFGTFGGPHILSLVTEVATRALKAVWFQKWFVHRRLRPEEFGGRIHFDMTAKRYYPINEEIEKSAALERIHAKYGTYFLPMAFPEGSPMHPAYGAGHATVAGACTTILKAWFDESFVLSKPVISSPCGTELVAYTGADKDKLTLGGELNKLAANIAIGRNSAGVHWRSDYTESIKLGEAIAISILEEQKQTYNENFNFSLTKFDGTTLML